MIISIFIVTSILPAFGLNMKSIKSYFWITIIGLSVLAFMYIPIEAVDLYRHYQMLDQLRIEGFSYFSLHKWDTLWIWSTYAYLISLLKYNGFLPAITIIIGYGCILNTLYKCCIKFNLSKYDFIFSFVFFLFLFNYVELLSGIRNMLSFCIFSHFLYIDLIENRKKSLCFIIYFLLCFLHSSMIIPLIIRTMLFLCKKYILILNCLVLLFWNMFLPLIINLLSLFSDSDFFGLLLVQVKGYTSTASYEINNVIIRTIILFTLIVVLTYCLNKKQEIVKYRKYKKFVILIIFFTLGSINVYDIYVRYTSFLLMIILPYTLFIQVKNKNNNFILSDKLIRIRLNLMTFIVLMISTGLFIFWSIFQYKDLNFIFNV